jgi:hypothetical protein
VAATHHHELAQSLWALLGLGTVGSYYKLYTYTLELKEAMLQVGATTTTHSQTYPHVVIEVLMMMAITPYGNNKPDE